MTVKAKIKSILQQAEREEQKFISDFQTSEEHVTGKIDSWTAKDIIAHVAHWKVYCVTNTQAFLRNERTAPCEDLDKENARVFEANKNKTWTEISSKLEIANRYAMECLALISDELLRSDTSAWQRGKPLWRMIVGSCYLHPVAHLAEYYSRHGKTDQAFEVLQQSSRLTKGLSDSKEWLGVVTYNLACGYALSGRPDEAIAELGKALEMDPGLVEWSKKDTDLDSIRKHKGYRAIYKT